MKARVLWESVCINSYTSCEYPKKLRIIPIGGLASRPKINCFFNSLLIGISTSHSLPILLSVPLNYFSPTVFLSWLVSWDFYRSLPNRDPKFSFFIAASLFPLQFWIVSSIYYLVNSSVPKFFITSFIFCSFMCSSSAKH